MAVPVEFLEFSAHARTVMAERQIPEDWVHRAIRSPDRSELSDDGNRHFLKAIAEHGGRILRVVVNARGIPVRVVTVFFDRRLRRRP